MFKLKAFIICLMISESLLESPISFFITNLKSLNLNVNHTSAVVNANVPSSGVGGTHTAPPNNSNLVPGLSKSSHVVVNHKANFFEAAHLCRQLKMHLVSIESFDELQAVKSYLAEHPEVKSKRVWTSGNNLAGPTFQWLGTGNDFSDAGWIFGEPTDSGNGRSCVSFLKSQSSINLRYDSEHCEDIRHPFICERN